MYTRSIYGVVFILIYGLSCIHCEELPIAGKVLICAMLKPHISVCVCVSNFLECFVFLERVGD